MPDSDEGYVLTTYGAPRYLKQAVACVTTLRRHDTDRAILLYCSADHQELLEQADATDIFQEIRALPDEHRSIVGVKHHLERFMPFDRTLWVDSDMIWCRDPEPLWRRFSTYSFTATGLPQADFWFGARKDVRVVLDYLLNRRRRTLKHFNLTHLPRVQSGMMFGRDRKLVQQTCARARSFLNRQDETHFISRQHEKGRTLESCEWSLAMAMADLDVPVFPWIQGQESPQLDYIDTLTTHDATFHTVRYRLYSDPFVYSLRGLPNPRLRTGLTSLFASLPGKGDYLDVTPYTLHFGWTHQKAPLNSFAEKLWEQICSNQSSLDILP